jgi:hypothetical protein
VRELATSAFFVKRPSKCPPLVKLPSKAPPPSVKSPEKCAPFVNLPSTWPRPVERSGLRSYLTESEVIIESFCSIQFPQNPSVNVSFIAVMPNDFINTFCGIRSLARARFVEANTSVA